MATSAAINAAIEKMYGSALKPDEWPLALTSISDCFDGAGCLLFFQKSDGVYSTLNSPGILDAANARFVSEGWNRRDLRAIRAQEAGTFGMKTTVGDYDVVTPEEMETHPYYAEFLAPFGLRWFLAASISPHPDVFAVLSVQRLNHQPNFSASERKLLESLARHAEQSLRLSCRLMQAEVANVVLGDALERVGCGVVLVNGEGTAVFHNVAGAPYSDLLRSEPRLAHCYADSAPTNRLQVRFNQIVKGDLSGDAYPAAPVLLAGGQDATRSVAYLLPVTNSVRSMLEETFCDVRAILIVVSQNTAAPADPSVVRDILGVTLGEARVASLIGAGMSPRDVANALGITEDTARTVLKRVFAKLNLSKQSQLTSLLSQLTLKEL